MVSEGHTLDGTYHLERLLGEGGMGAVYEATHARLAGRYAIKVLLRELSDVPGIRARFEQEARITSLLQHPNVVQVIDHNTTADGTSYLVMEYLSGESLAARLAREGRLAVAQVVDIVDQIAAGLAAAHAHGVVHRDLKPDNVFLVPVEGRGGELVKILDFGISKANWRRDTTDGQICGTPQYMAPEQAEGRAADVDATTDQYALAVITHELLTGSNPYAAESIEAVFARIQGGVVPATGMPGAVDPVLARALAKDRALRFPSVTAFAEALRAAAAESETEPEMEAERRPAAPARRARRGGRGWRLGLATATAVAIASFVGSGSANRAAQRPAFEQRQPPATTEGVAPAATAAAAEEAIARPPAVETKTILADSLAPAAAPAATPESARPPARRVRARRPARDDRPHRAGPAEPTRGAPPSTLGPDEDATLPPSEL
ncbi:MAG TPA: serine/threonine-protein kinase [Polyangia bacterium]